MGQIFWQPKFVGFRMAKTPKIATFVKNGPTFKKNP